MSSDAFILKGTVDVDVNDAVNSLNQVDNKVNSSGNTIEGLTGKISNVGKALVAAFSVKAVAEFGMNCLNAASDVEEMQNKFDVVFEGIEDQVESWASNFSNAVGRNKNEIKTYLADNQNMFVGMGMTREAGAEMSEQLVSLALDLASFNNLNEADAVEKMSKAIMGETESAKSLGAVLNDNTKALAMEALGMEGKYANLTEAEKMEVNYQAILMQSTDAVGDAERSSNSYANQIRRTQAKVQELTQTLGTYFLPMATNVITIGGNLVDGVIAFVQKIADGIDKMKEEFNATGEYLDGFVALWETVFGEMPQSFYNMVDGVITFFYFLWDSIKQAVDTIAVPIINIVKDIFTQLKNHSDTIFNAVGEFFYNMAFVIQSIWQTVGQPVFDLIVYIIQSVYQVCSFYFPDMANVFSSMVSTIQSLWVNVLQPVFNVIGQIITTFLVPAFKVGFNAIMGVVSVCFSGIIGLWNNSLKPIFDGIITFITGVFTGNWSRAWQGVVDILGGIFSGIVDIVKAPINAVIGLINGAIDGLNGISVDIPEWVPGVGGKTFGVDIPNMSFLENGGILTEPTMIAPGILAGEKNKGRNGQAEAVIPLTRMFDEVQQLGNNIANTTANANVSVLNQILSIIKDKEFTKQTNYNYEFRDNNFDSSETKETLSQIRFASNF